MSNEDPSQSEKSGSNYSEATIEEKVDEETKNDMERMERELGAPFTRWYSNRKNLIAAIRDTAEKMFVFQKKVSTISVGSSVLGVAGGALTLGAMAFPPTAFLGIAVSTLAGVSGIAMDLTEMNAFKRSLERIEKMIEEDEEYVKQLEDVYEKYFAKNFQDGSVRNANRNATDVLKSITIATNLKFAFWIKRCIGRSALKVSSVSGIFLDGWRLFLSQKGLSEKSELIKNLETLANELENHLEKEIAKRMSSKPK